MTATPELPGEVDQSWVETVARFKQMILMSFDARVRQYEDDIREKDAQRRLPGWNFCTFFVLKEGLARAFESVGLVEDALVGYDELAFGLEGVLEEKTDLGATFAGYTRESLAWLDQARAGILARRKGKRPGLMEVEEGMVIDAEKKHYRDLILSNEISVFDFKCYIFSRQIALLLRLGSRYSETGPVGAEGRIEGEEVKMEEDLTRISEVTKRGVEFVTQVARILRADLAAAVAALPPPAPEDGDETEQITKEEIAAVVENLAASWTYSVCAQLLQATSASALPPALTGSADSEEGLHPKRTSSLNDDTAVTLAQAAKSAVTGIEDLAAGRGEITVLARGVLEQVARRRGWFGEGNAGWFGEVGEVMGVDGDDGMREISLDNEPVKTEKVADIWVPEGIRNKTLKETMIGDEDEHKEGSEEEFHQLFLRLSELALKHFGVAKRAKSAERVEADLAALRL